MTQQHDGDEATRRDKDSGAQAISIVQRGNLKALEATLRKQWRLGQNIVLCWSADQRGLLVILVPHYFLGNYCAGEATADSNETFVRELISGRRRKSRDDLFEVADRLGVSPTFIRLDTALSEEASVLAAVEQLIRRYGLSYVDNRAVLLFDIVDFSLATPFEQASQLNSLSYSFNSAYNKLLTRGVEINFARTTTGDGYYVWNRDLGPHSNQDLFLFLCLVTADNAVAREASRGNTVPVIRTGYHVGSHYELYQAEGVNPTVFSYIVGDVTIELARMLDLAQGSQILLGNFHCEVTPPHAGGEEANPELVETPGFVRHCDGVVDLVKGIALSGKAVDGVRCYLTAGSDGVPRRFRITDKHGLSRNVYNLQLEVGLDGRTLELGLDESALPARPAAPESTDPEGADQGPVAAEASAEELLDDLASMVRRRGEKQITED
jgi:hypothetical protein